MSIQFFAFKTRIVIHNHLRVKIKRRLKEAISLIVTRGAAVERSSGGPKLVFRAEDVGADKWIAPGACVLFHSAHHFFSRPYANVELSYFFLLLMCCATDWTYMVLPSTTMFRMPFTEQLDLIRNALGDIHRRIPQVEGSFKSVACEARDAIPKQGRNLPGPNGRSPLTA